MVGVDVIARARKEGRTVLTEVESKELLREAGIPVVETSLARTSREALAHAERLGYPVVMKIVSPDILHKSDVGGVRLGVRSQAEARLAYRELLAAAARANPGAILHGVSVQRQAAPGVEVVVGMAKDPQFGPFLMFGLGGVLVEVLNDVAFRLVPLARRDARAMVREVKGYPLLAGHRGQPPVDTVALEQALLALSRFAEAHPEIRELDLNPVLAYPQGVLAVDARVVLEGA